MHIIDPDTLAEVWGIAWEQIEEMGDGGVIDENEYVFTLEGGQVLVFSHDEPDQIRYWVNGHGRTTDVIEFKNISRVVYSKERQSLAVESVNGEWFSDMVIRASGKFSLTISTSMRLYVKSFCNMLEANGN